MPEMVESLDFEVIEKGGLRRPVLNILDFEANATFSQRNNTTEGIAASSKILSSKPGKESWGKESSDEESSVRMSTWVGGSRSRCRICSEHVQEGGGSSGTCSCYHPTNSSNLDIESCARINMGRGLLLKDVHSKEKGVFGDLSSLSDFSELSQSAQ